MRNRFISFTAVLLVLCFVGGRTSDGSASGTQ